MQWDQEQEAETSAVRSECAGLGKRREWKSCVASCVDKTDCNSVKMKKRCGVMHRTTAKSWNSSNRGIWKISYISYRVSEEINYGKY